MLHFLLIFLFGTLSLDAIALKTQNTSICLDSNFEAFVDKNTNAHTWNSCQWTHKDMILHPSYLRFPSSEDPNDTQPQSAPFDIAFRCYHVPDEICQKAERAFKKAGEIIASVILFRESVRVNATLMSFCAVGNECNKKMMTLGGSSPARAMPLVNDDGLLRLHPQALVKQFGLSDHPAFAPYDILSVFNADAPFWFEEDGLAIGPNQADFTFVVLHEFMHGLGFYSGWNQYISSKALTPDPSPFLANQLLLLMNPMTNAIHPSQFLESAMDRLMGILNYDQQGKTPTGTQTLISDLTRRLNQIQASTLSDLADSSDFSIAHTMYQYATTPGSLGVFVSSEEAPVILETELQPYQPGSSISHVAFKEYTNTPEFLMRYMQDRGLSLSSAVERGGGNGPIGPLLLRILEHMGYSTVDKPNVIPPLLIFQRQDIGFPFSKVNSRKSKHFIDQVIQPDLYTSASVQHKASFHLLLLTIFLYIFV